MTPEFWQKKWQSNQLGFNQNKPNPMLIEYLPTLNLAQGSRIFVPLCGKSIDMLWLAEQQFEVVGVELVETAVAEFFTENNISASVHPHESEPNLKYYQGRYNNSDIIIWVGDIFLLNQQDIGAVDAIYDRAALVALPDDGTNDSLRVRYAQQLIKLAPKAQQLLLSFGLSGVDETEYANYSGPPFLIPTQRIHDYYQHAYQLVLLESYETQKVNNEGKPFLNLAWHLIPAQT